MGVRTPGNRDADDWVYRTTNVRAFEPSRAAAMGLTLVVWLLLLANGRPISAGDTRVNDHVAASLVQERDFDLDEYPEVEPPWVREDGGRRVSIYPVMSSLMAVPIFAAARVLFPLDETGAALAGKVAASLFSSLAAAVLFMAVARRRGESDGMRTALLFALGTSVCSTSQALWQHPAAVLFIAIALLFFSRAEDDSAWAGRAGLPLGLAFAARHADVAIVAVLALAAAVRWPRRIPWLALWALPPLGFVAWYNGAHFGSPWSQGFGDASARFGAWGVGHAGLLISPAKGLLVFTPLVLIGVLGLLRTRPQDRALAATAAAAAIAHWAFVGGWNEWHGGESWGPRMMTDALPALLLFLPEGFGAMNVAGVLLAAVSCAVQIIGAFSYDLRWERLHQRPNGAGPESLWRLDDNPIVFHVRERVAIFAAPGLADGKVVIRRHPIVIAGPTGTRTRFGAGEVLVEGTPPTLGDVHLQNAARLEGDAAVLRGNWAGVFLRVRPESRMGPLLLSVEGRGHGTLYVGERSFWSTTTRWTTYSIAGAFDVHQRYFYPESGGPDIVVTVGRGGGEAEIRAISLVPPSVNSLTVAPSRGERATPAASPSPR
jgi:hypothetical protein